MGADNQYRVIIKNSFLEVLPSEEEVAKPRCRAVSEFTGVSQAQAEEARSASQAVSPQKEEVALQDKSSAETEAVDEAWTTLMLRNIPNAYAADTLVELLDVNGFHGRYDFTYLPIDFRTGVNLGYAFLNLVSHHDALDLIQRFQGFCGWACDSPKVCEVSWAYPYQGLEAHIERYRSSPVMHESVPDSYRPRLFVMGQRIPFPRPLKHLKAPRVRPARRGA